jgi:hypothetical protein
MLLLGEVFTDQMQQKLDNFIYRPLLRTYESSFRLFILYPGKPGDHLHGQLITKEFDKRDTNQRYEALSYAWGDKALRKSMTLFGKHFPITQNLYEALQHVRSETSNRTIWVDAICINQADAPERTLQVSMMGDIYKCARRVINWLGPSTPDTALGMKVLAFLFGKFGYHLGPTMEGLQILVDSKGVERYPPKRLFSTGMGCPRKCSCLQSDITSWA